MEQPKTEHYRLFIAIEAAEPVKDRLEEVQRDLRALIPGPALRWSKREQFHLTLKFLGNVDAGAVPDLVAAVAEATNPFAPLDLHAVGLGCFPTIRRPRVLWAGVTDARSVLPELQRAIEAASAPFSAEPAEPEGKFQGHITLARIKEMPRSEVTILAQFVEKLGALRLGDWVSPRVEIIRSQLSPKGARYTSVAAVQLPG